MTVYVGIVAYNSADDLPHCLDAITQQTFADLHITVFDNASDDDSAQIAQVRGVTVTPSSQNIGFARAHNHILGQLTLAPDDYYMPLNPDVTLTATYIQHLVNGLAAHQAGWGTGKLYHDAVGTLYSVGHALRRDGYAVNIGYHLQDTGQFASDRAIFGAPGAAPLYTAALVHALCDDGAFFDPHMFLYAEDVDVDWRAQRQGWTCWYIADAIAYHRGSDARGDLRTQALGNRFLSVLKNAYWRDLLTYNIPLMIVHMGARLVLSPRQGVRLVGQVMRGAWPMFKARRRPVVRRAAFVHWLREDAPTAQPMTLRTRLRAFWKKRRAET
jgi:GT2 family glycosyltransferase